MKRADACEIRIQRVTPRVDVADFRMHEAMQWSAAHHHPAADSRADRHVYQIVDIACRTPTLFRQRRGVHVGIESDRHGKFSRQHSHDIDIAPSGFWSTADKTVTRRCPVQNHGAKAADANGGERAAARAAAAQKVAHGRKRRGRVGGRRSASLHGCAPTHRRLRTQTWCRLPRRPRTYVIRGSRNPLAFCAPVGA